MKNLMTIALFVAACGGKTPAPPPAENTAPPAGSAGSGSAATPDPDCVCTMEYKPVCGADGKTYGNACAAGCAHVAVASTGECPK